MSDITAIVENLFQNIWRLFSGLTIPGLGMTAAQLFIALFVVSTSLNLISLLTGMHTDVGSADYTIRTGKERISQYRRHQSTQALKQRGRDHYGWH